MVQNLKIAESRVFILEAFRLTLFKRRERKTNLISTLAHRALVIYSKSTLQNELSNIRLILIDNSYPEAVINAALTKKINQFHRPTCSVSRLALHRAAMPNIFLSFFIFFY